MNDIEAVYMIQAWSLAEALAFSSHQRSRVSELAQQTGVRTCIAEGEAAARRHGIPLNRAETEKLTAEQLKRQGDDYIAMFREMMTSDKRCSLNHVNFIEQVADLATPEQRANYAPQLKLLRDLAAAKRAELSVTRR